MAKVSTLVTRADREQRAAVSALSDALRDLPPHVLVRLSGAERASIYSARKVLRKHGRGDEILWCGGYNMISRVQAKHVYDRIKRLPPHKRPVQVRDAFMFILLCLEQDEPELPFTRDDVAREVGCDPANVSRIMATLEELGVLTRERRREPGYRGRGRVAYVVNAHTAWNGNLEFRKRVAARQQPPTEKRPNLKLVQPKEAAE